MASGSDCSSVYIAEYSTHGRRHCRHCKKTIKTKELCLGLKVARHDVVLWYHSSCFVRVNDVDSSQEIEHFSLLRFSDQELISTWFRSKPKESPGTGRLPSAFSISYAKLSSTCKVCQKAIQKMELCVLKQDYDIKLKQIHEVCHGYHINCFAHVREILGYCQKLKEMPGFNKLCEEDKKKLHTSDKRKRSSSPEQPTAKKINVTEDRKLKEQSDMLFEIRDKLESSLKHKELIMILQQNNQIVPNDQNMVLNVLADCVAFGALRKCPVCKGQLLLGDRGYKCQGHATKWTSCIYETVRPARQNVVFPSELAKKCECLSSYISKCATRSRKFPPKPAAVCNRLKPLYNFKFVVVGFEKKEKKDVLKQILYLGGEVLDEINSNVTCIVASEDIKSEYEEAMKSAEKNNVTVVAVSFLSAAKYGQAAYHLAEHSLKPWGIGISEEAKALKELMEKQEVKKNFIMGSVAVSIPASLGPKTSVHRLDLYYTPDPDSGLVDKAEVVVAGSKPYSCVLGLVDIKRGLNCFYKIQVLKEEMPARCSLFESWGQVGFDIFGKTLSYFPSVTSAAEKFRSLYHEKTGNLWSSKVVLKKPNCYYPLKIDNGQDDFNILKDIAVSPSKLSEPVQSLIAMICNVNLMEKVMLEYKIDTKLMPLGKLSKDQILQAYKVLKDLEKVLRLRSKSKKIKIISASNQFYTLIPHSFGLVNPPLLDSQGAIQEKTKMLDSLMEIQWAYKLISNGASNKPISNANPIDCNYKKLNADIETVDPKSQEFQDIELYFKMGDGSAKYFHLELLQVYKVCRHGEREKYNKKCSKLVNKKLLWHGSAVTNYVGILSRGLRISPPGVPLNGQMFGKGIYFSDVVIKSISYCRTSNSNSIGLLLLCEVALGNICHMSSAVHMSQPPNSTHSVKGVGSVAPDPKQSIFRDGVEIPCGKMIRSNTQGINFCYNEYVVYHENQVNIRYLVMFKRKNSLL